MKIQSIIGAVAILVVTIATPGSIRAEVISGSILNWSELESSIRTIGDDQNHVSLYWSLFNSDRGWFYGRNLTGDSDVAFASGVSDISQVTDASLFNFSSGADGPRCDADCSLNGVGDFLIWRNISTGHYGALRLDDITAFSVTPPVAELSGTWWFQTDGSSNLAPIPIPAAVWMFCSGLLTIVSINKKSSIRRSFHTRRIARISK